jgi:hypothetical protein
MTWFYLPPGSISVSTEETTNLNSTWALVTNLAHYSPIMMMNTLANFQDSNGQMSREAFRQFMQQFLPEGPEPAHWNGIVSRIYDIYFPFSGEPS